MGTFRRFAKLNRMEVVRIDCDLSMPRTGFQYQMDLQIHMCVKHWGVDLEEKTSTFQILEMAEVFEDYGTAAAKFNRILDVLRAPRNFRSLIISRLFVVGRMIGDPFKEVGLGRAFLVVDISIELGRPPSASAFYERPKTSLKRVRAEENRAIKRPRRSHKEEKNITCAVCLDDIIAESAAYMPCGHVFHKKCIGRWLEGSHSCPLCRFRICPHTNVRVDGKRTIFTFRAS